ncbi:MAG: fibronectin type III domain-containing protein [Bacteroidota bacterium]|nr:fibronectin type III domain-containing protein [Bacteroidota bacterium]
MKHFPGPVTGAILTALLLAACSEIPDGVDDPDIKGPTNLRAFSADTAIVLFWTPSPDEAWPNFDKYRITIRNKSTGETSGRDVPKTSRSMRIGGLTNGIRYAIVMHGVTTAGKKSIDSAAIEWSPASRVIRDILGKPITVYATTSEHAGGLDLDADSGRAEIVALSSVAFRSRAEFFVQTAHFAAPLEICSPDLWYSNPGAVTEFSTVPPIDSDVLDAGAATSSPPAATYTLKTVTIEDGFRDKGRIYFGRVTRGTEKYYFRLLVKRSPAGGLIHGSGPDRYLEVEASFQTVPHVPYAKP